ncbi:MAG: hypothetical protein V1736_07090 [Pseudomonadota bacterium]
MKTGVPALCNYVNGLDSGFRRNDKKQCFSTTYELIKYGKMKMLDCHKCKHYYVTWENGFPHGCRAMRFKSRDFPSRVVHFNSGSECLLFDLKGKSPGKETGGKEK